MPVQIPTAREAVLERTNLLQHAVRMLEQVSDLWDDHGLQLTILDVKSLYGRSCAELNHHAEEEAA